MLHTCDIPQLQRDTGAALLKPPEMEVNTQCGPMNVSKAIRDRPAKQGQTAEIATEALDNGQEGHGAGNARNTHK